MSTLGTDVCGTGSFDMLVVGALSVVTFSPVPQVSLPDPPGALPNTERAIARRQARARTLGPLLPGLLGG